MFAKTAKFLKRFLRFRRVVGLYRRRLSRRVYRECGGVVQHGPLAGMRWLDNPGWGRGEQGNMVLGLYEQEVLSELTGVPEHYRVFVDVGAADGYYAVGLAFCGKADRCVAFEMLPACRAAIGRLAKANGVADRITILGAAEGNFVDALQAQNLLPKETMFLIDIEGSEFQLLTAEFFVAFSESIVVVESHAHIFPDPQAQLDELTARAAETHTVRSWQPGARDPWVLAELDAYSEVDRWILCSEGRTERQLWLRFDPR